MTTRCLRLCRRRTRRPISSCSSPGLTWTRGACDATLAETIEHGSDMRSERYQTAERRQRPKKTQLAPLKRSSMPSNMPMMKRLLPGQPLTMTRPRMAVTAPERISGPRILRVMQPEPGHRTDDARGQQACADQQRQDRPTPARVPAQAKDPGRHIDDAADFPEKRLAPADRALKPSAISVKPTIATRMPMVSTDATVAVAVMHHRREACRASRRHPAPRTMATSPSTLGSEGCDLGERVNPEGGCKVMMRLSGRRVDKAMNKADSAGRFVLGICDFNVDVGNFNTAGRHGGFASRGPCA